MPMWRWLAIVLSVLLGCGFVQEAWRHGRMVVQGGPPLSLIIQDVIQATACFGVAGWAVITRGDDPPDEQPPVSFD